MRKLRSFILAISVTTFAAASVAQEASSDAGVEPTIQERLGSTQAKLLELEKELASADGDNRAVIEGRIEETVDQLTSEIDELTSEVDRRRKAGEDPAPLVDVAQKALAAQLAEINRELDRLDQSIRELRSQSPENEAAENERQTRIAKAEGLYESYLTRYQRVVSQLQALSLSVEKEDAALNGRLKQRADDAMAIYKLALEREQEIAGRETTSDDEKAAKDAELARAQAKVKAAKKAFDGVLTLMEKRDIETVEYRQFLFEKSGEITTQVLDKDVAIGLMQKWMASGKQWAVDNGPRLVFKGLLFFLILALFWVLARVSSRLVGKALSGGRISLSKLLREFFQGLAAKLVMLFGVLIALTQLGINLGPLLAGLGVAGFIVGFALQNTLSNFASGLMILAYRPYDVGDLVEVGGVTGTVSEMTLVSTTILTLDHQRLIVPNNKVWGEVIRNVTAEPIRRVDLVFGISYSDDIDKARDVLGQILEADDKVLDDPAPVVKLHTLNDSSVDFVVRPWCKTADYWDTHWDVTRAVKKRFDAEGISIPFPQRDVHLFQEGSSNG